ncbi:MAG: aminotransferase class V-fold PLP-dependent enzyme [Terracidiphilus sp.]
MKPTRREMLAGLGGLAVLNAGQALQGIPSAAPDDGGRVVLPAKEDFAIPAGLTYINSAYTHPLTRSGVKAIADYAEARSVPSPESGPINTKNVKAEFAALINAKESEISYVPNTSTGENLIVDGLGIPRSGGNVVTDALHFEGAILHLQALQQRFGLDLRIVPASNWQIEMSDLEKVVDKKTRLIEVSLVAMDNGFEHDLKAVCGLAHAHGAYVYADIVQAAGNTPIDVKASGVDFCACSSFKWLMGDFGLGFLYVKESLLDTVLHRTQYGYYQATKLESHFLPGDSPNPSPYTWELGNSASAHFEVGTQASGVVRILSESLPYIRRIGPENIRAHRQPLLKRLHEEMPRLGFQSLTPAESTSALISFTLKDSAAVRARLQKANVNVRVSDRFIRISPSVFNDMGDIDRLLEALS